MKARILGVVAAFAVIAVTTQASATIIYVTYKGVVTSDIDQTGVFGFVDSSSDRYAGKSYTADYVFDSTKGFASDPTNPNLKTISGGSYYSSTSPAVSASVTVNGVTVLVDPSYVSGIWAYPSEQIHIAHNYYDNGIIHFDNYLQNLVLGGQPYLPLSLVGPFTFTIGSSGPNDYGGGEFYLYESNNGVTLEHTDIKAQMWTLTVSSAEISPGVPEPSTWILMLTGLAGVGFLAYRRTKRRSAAIAVA